MNILQAAIDSLWMWTYGLIVGWGASFTVAVGLIILLFIKVIHLRKRLIQLENRVITAEREHSFHVRDFHEAANHMSDKGYEIITHEKQAEFKRKRKTPI